MEEPLPIPKTQKLWSIGQIGVASFLSGPIGGCFLISQNFKVLGEKKAAKKTFWFGALATLLIFAICFSLPEELVVKFPKVIVPAMYTALLTSFARKRQKGAIDAHLQQGGKRASHFKLIGISILFLLLLTTIVFGMISIAMGLGLIT